MTERMDNLLNNELMKSDLGKADKALNDISKDITE
jgi:hypothetical protein